MYSSLLPWCKFPIFIHKFVARTSSGDEQYALPQEVKGYPIGKIQTILNKYGEEYISHMQIYFPPNVNIAIQDMISTPEDTSAREIQRLNCFFDGEEGAPSILVVYL
jgi:hypothetical protein